MSRSSNWYTRWPEWLRWMLCFPVSVLFSLLVGFFVASLLAAVGQEERLSWLVQPTAGLFAFIFGMYRMTPRWKYLIVLSLVSTYAAATLLCSVGLLIGTALLPQHVVTSEFKLWYWKSVFSAVLGFSAGFVYLAWMERRESTSGNADEPLIAESDEAEIQDHKGTGYIREKLGCAAWCVYACIGLVQLVAILDGIQAWLDMHLVFAAPLAVILSYIPLVGSVLAIVSVVLVWEWHWLGAVALFGSPYIVMLLAFFIAED